MRTVLTLRLGTVRRLGRSRRDLLLENLALRHQLAMCERRPWVRNPDRLLWAQVLRRWPGWRDALLVLEPATVVRWHRAGVATVLDLEEPREAARTAADPRRGPRADSPPSAGESPLGGHADPR